MSIINNPNNPNNPNNSNKSNNKNKSFYKKKKNKKYNNYSKQNNYPFYNPFYNSYYTNTTYPYYYTQPNEMSFYIPLNDNKQTNFTEKEFLLGDSKNNDLFNFSDSLEKGIEDYLNKFSESNENKEKNEELNKVVFGPRRYQWLKLEINNLEDLINLGKKYGKEYLEDVDYNINLKMISNMIEELEDLNKLVGLEPIKKQIIDIILYYSLNL